MYLCIYVIMKMVCLPWKAVISILFLLICFYLFCFHIVLNPTSNINGKIVCIIFVSWLWNRSTLIISIIFIFFTRFDQMDYISGFSCDLKWYTDCLIIKEKFPIYINCYVQNNDEFLFILLHSVSDDLCVWIF